MLCGKAIRGTGTEIRQSPMVEGDTDSDVIRHCHVIADSDHCAGRVGDVGGGPVGGEGHGDRLGADGNGGGDGVDQRHRGAALVGDVGGKALWTDRHPAIATGLPCDSVVNITALVTLNKTDLTDRIGEVSPSLMHEVDRGLRRILNL